MHGKNLHFSRRMRNEIASCSRRVLTSVNITECTIFHTVQVHRYTDTYVGTRITNTHANARAREFLYKVQSKTKPIE